MPKKREYKPKGSNVTIRIGKRGGKQFRRVTRTKRGMKRVIYDYRGKKK